MSVKIKSKEELDRHWRGYVKAAKVKMSRYQKVHMDVAALAIEAGNIQWMSSDPWKNHENFYSLSAYADAIGMKQATLRNWVTVKLRVYDKLSAKDQKTATAEAYVILVKTQAAATEDASKKDVKKAYDEVRTLRLNKSAQAVEQTTTRLKFFRELAKNKSLATLSKKDRAELTLELQKAKRAVQRYIKK